LADIDLFNDEVWEATLLYSQVDKSMKEEPLGHEARFRNANCVISSVNSTGRKPNSTSSRPQPRSSSPTMP
jgi:hypothetical protein